MTEQGFPVTVFAEILPGKEDPSARAGFNNYDRAAEYAALLTNGGSYSNVVVEEGWKQPSRQPPRMTDDRYSEQKRGSTMADTNAPRPNYTISGGGGNIIVVPKSYADQHPHLFSGGGGNIIVVTPDSVDADELKAAIQTGMRELRAKDKARRAARTAELEDRRRYFDA